MSSHHFVKEGQEPALFIVDALSFDKAAPLLEWAPLVLVFEDVLEDVLRWGIKIDAVLTRSENESGLAEKLADQHPIAIVKVTHAENVVEKGFDFLRSKNSSVANVMTKTNIVEFDKAHSHLDFQCTLLNETARWSLIRRKHFEKWVEAGAELMIFTQHPHDVMFEGCERDATMGKLLSRLGGVIRVTSEHEFWMGEPF